MVQSCAATATAPDATTADTADKWPKAVPLCIAVTVFAMATQNTVVKQIPITVADILAGVSLLLVLWAMFRRGLRAAVPGSLIALVLVFHVAALLARSSLPGAIEAVQRTEQFFVGGILFIVLLSSRAKWLATAATFSIAANVLLALVQAGFLSGFGPKVCGAFRSRAALDAWLLIAGAWCLPVWLSSTHGLKRVGAFIIGVALLLGVMAHGQLLLAAIVVFAAVAFLHSNRSAFLTLLGILVFAASLWIGPAGPARRSVLAETLSPFHSGRIKQCHTELVAAMRMAAAHPWSGIGLGHYQQWIGTFYRELPNPNINEIETDTQSGWGILLGTAGFVAGILFMLVLLGAATRGIRVWFENKRSHPLFLAGAGAVIATGVAMFVTDPLIRGTGWYVVLGLVSALRPAPGGQIKPAGLSWKGVVGWGALFALLAAATALTKPPTDELLLAAPPVEAPAPPAAGQARPGQAAAQERETDFKSNPDFFLVIDATEAVEFTPPVIKDKDPRAAHGVILRIPDEKGKPPEGAQPDMKYGGAKYIVDVPCNVLCNVWVRVWWEGSCGNSLYYRHPDGTTLAVGNDGTYNAWHWLRVPGTFKFHKGKNVFYLLNREDGIRIDQILITGDLAYVPQGIEEPE